MSLWLWFLIAGFFCFAVTCKLERATFLTKKQESNKYTLKKIHERLVEN